MMPFRRTNAREETPVLKNITLSVDESLIQRARSRAALEKRTLYSAFREWLARYAGKERDADAYRKLMSRLDYAKPGMSFDRTGQWEKPVSPFSMEQSEES